MTILRLTQEGKEHHQEMVNNFRLIKSGEVPEYTDEEMAVFVILEDLYPHGRPHYKGMDINEMLEHYSQPASPFSEGEFKRALMGAFEEGLVVSGTEEYVN